MELIPGIPGFGYADLHDAARLRDLYEHFLATLRAADAALADRYDAWRADPDALGPVETSTILTDVAPHVSAYVATLFGVTDERRILHDAIHADDPVFRFKVDLVRRRATGRGKAAVAPEADVAAAAERAMAALRSDARWPFAPAGGVVVPSGDLEGETARFACLLLDAEAFGKANGADTPLPAPMAESVAAMRVALGAPDEDASATVARALAHVIAWCAVRVHDAAGHPDTAGWVSFKTPEPIDYDALVRVERPRADVPEILEGPQDTRRRRDGFALTDGRMDRRHVLGEVHYCVYCHERDKDSCSKGFPTPDGGFKSNPLGIVLDGCPLDEKIGEAHAMMRDGDALAALALVTVDNPMCPGTGHRICNNCMKGCIYQTQDPVNIPEIETGVLTDVLRLRWGVEIYGLLTRWNPLNVRRPYPRAYRGRNVMVVGLGPAGYTLAHHLLNEGFGVVGIDGLKIEPLDVALVGDPAKGVAPAPIERWDAIYKGLGERILEGFGGVSEYGITVRWDKNFLTLLHLTLARRDKLRIFDGVRFGGTLTAADTWDLGFDHIAIAAGAGKPTVIEMGNNLSRGIRKASDFLMALQLTGAAKRDSLANLQVRLPGVVIGGGLTAIDTATELLAYYPVQVEKMLDRVEAMAADGAEPRLWSRMDAEEKDVLEEFLAHGRAIRAERARAAAAGQAPDFVPLLRQWGGVTLAYRKSMADSPAYRLNHEEVAKALEEGIQIAECMDPEDAQLDAFGAVASLRFRVQALVDGRWAATERTVTLPARSVMVAAGTVPNIGYAKEHPGVLGLDARGRFFKGHRAERGADGRWHPVPAEGAPDAFFTSYDDDGRLISFYGDNHPTFAGNVVKAMASAKFGFPHVAALFEDDDADQTAADQPAREADFHAFADRLTDALEARVHAVNRLTETIVEVIVRAPMAARQFHPGQFYRLQSYESTSPVVAGTRLTMEGIALTGAWVDPDAGLLSLIILEMGASSRLCAQLAPGTKVVVMGPTGAPTEIPQGESVLLAGGGLGNAVLFSIAEAMRRAGNRVVYFAGYKRGEDLFKREEVEEATDQVIWSTDSGAEIVPSRPQDVHFRGNIVQAMLAYGEGRLTEPVVPLSTIDRIIAIGSDRMMRAVKDARRGVLAPHLVKDPLAIGSINSPMQCMMKEVCAQCLQKHVDPVTGMESFVFSCVNQDQRLDDVDFDNLAARLRVNTVQEKVANMWLDHLLALQGAAG
ncbi:MAG: FAD-dependent oxidoreductase [Ardenticatenales bacterium]